MKYVLIMVIGCLWFTALVSCTRKDMPEEVVNTTFFKGQMVDVLNNQFIHCFGEVESFNDNQVHVIDVDCIHHEEFHIESMIVDSDRIQVGR